MLNMPKSILLTQKSKGKVKHSEYTGLKIFMHPAVQVAQKSLEFPRGSFTNVQAHLLPKQ